MKIKICLLHIVDTPNQFAGTEHSLLTLAKYLQKEDDIEIIVALNKGKLLEKIKDCGIRTYVLPDKGLFRVPLFQFKFWQLTKSFSPHIVHSQHRFPTLLAHFIPFRNYRLIHTFRLELFTKKRLSFLGDHATAVSQGVKAHFVKEFGLKDEFISVIYNAVEYPPLRHVKDSADYLLPPKKPGETIAILIGRLTEQKGHIVFLNALSLMPHSVREKFRVFFVGDGEKRQELEQVVKNRGLENRVMFIGYQDNVYQYLDMSDFSVQPSLWEGFGLSVIESYHCGKPVIASNVGGLPEVVIDNETGLLVPPKDPEALMKAILKFINEPELVKKYGEAGKRFGLEKFSLDRMVSNYKALYQKLLESN